MSSRRKVNGSGGRNPAAFSNASRFLDRALALVLGAFFAILPLAILPSNSIIASKLAASRVLFLLLSLVALARLWLPVRHWVPGAAAVCSCFRVSLLCLIGFGVLVAGFTIWGHPYPHVGTESALRWGTLIALFATCAFVLDLPSSRSVLLKSVIVGALLSSIYAVLQFLGLDLLDWSLTRVHVHALVGQHNVLSAYLILVLPLMVLGVVELKARAWRCVSAVGVAGAVLVLALSMSRSGWIGTGAAILVAIALVRSTGRPLPLRRSLGWGWIWFSGVCAGILALVFYTSPEIRERASSLLDLSLHQNRMLIWTGVLAMIAERPIFGWGPGTLGHYFPLFRPPDFAVFHRFDEFRLAHAHNEFLEIGAEHGLTGLALFLGFLIGLLVVSARFIRTSHGGSAEERAWVIALLSGIAGVLVASCFSVNLRAVLPPSLLWIELGLLVALVSGRTSRDREPGLPETRGRARSAPSWAVWSARLAALGLGWGLLSSVPRISDLLWEDRISSLASAAATAGEAKHALRLLDGLLERSPAHARAYYLRGGLYSSQGRYDRAVADYLSLQQLDPHFVFVHYNLAYAYYKLGRHAEAEAELELQVAIDPKNVDVLYLQARVRMHQGSFSKALESLTRAIELDPYRSELRRMSADAHFELGELEGALEGYDEFLHLEPEDLAVRMRAATTALTLGRDEDAALRFRHAMLLLERKDASVAEEDRLWPRHAKPLEDANRRILERNPDLPAAHFNLGMLSARDQRFDLAAEHFARSEGASTAEARYRTGLARARGGRPEEAIRWFERALEELPAHGAALCAARPWSDPKAHTSRPWPELRHTDSEAFRRELVENYRWLGSANAEPEPSGVQDAGLLAPATSWTATDVVFGGRLRLLAYSFEDRYELADTIRIDFLFEVLAPISVEYTALVHILERGEAGNRWIWGADQPVLATSDVCSVPSGPEKRGRIMTEWEVGEVVRSRLWTNAKAEGEFFLRLGFFEASSRPASSGRYSQRMSSTTGYEFVDFRERPIGVSSKHSRDSSGS